MKIAAGLGGILLLFGTAGALAAEAVPILRLAAPTAAEPEGDGRAGGPLPVAALLPAPFTSSSHGAWRPSPEGFWTWDLAVESPGAAGMALELDASGLPAGTRLLVAAGDGELRGAPPGVLADGARWLPLGPGDRVRLRLQLPAGRDPAEALLRSSRAAHAWSEAGSGASLEKHHEAEDCMVSVACPEAEPWADEIRSVARYTYPQGQILYLCSGQLVMDVPATFRPWFLTADHCGVSANNADSVVVYWNYESSTCSGAHDASLDDSQSGAFLRFSDAASDTALLELSASPPEGYGVHHAGWDASGAVPAAVVGLHHPGGEEKAISFSDRALQPTRNCIATRFQDSHWWVPGWDLGVTAQGSSGSGIWDAGSSRLVGVLSGGASQCDTPEGFDCYGRFGVAWANGLSDWLDPEATGTLEVAGSDPGEPCAGSDSDEDGVADSCDVCPDVSDAGQADLDGDGVGDACDGCVRHPDPAQLDSDSDGRTDGCEFVYGDVAPAGAPDSAVNVSDVLRLLRAAVDLELLSATELEAGNVSPAVLDDSQPPWATPQGGPPRDLSVSDVQLCLSAAVGLVRFVDPS